MLKELIQEIANKYGCDERSVKVGPLLETSVFLEMGPSCQECKNAVKCKNDLINKLTEVFP